MKARSRMAVLGGVVLAGILSFYLYGFLGFDGFRADVAGYWQDSEEWAQPFDRFHVPLWPLTLAAARFLTLDALPPLWLCLGLAVGCHLIAIVGVVRWADRLDSGSWGTALGLAFSAWPLVGVTYVVYPVADALALALYVWGALSFLEEKPTVGSGLLGLGLITHKGLWPMVLAAVAALAIGRKWRARPGQLLLLAGPLFTLWSVGWIVVGDPLWIVRTSLTSDSFPRARFGILDGVVGPFLQGGSSGLAKGIAVFGSLALAGGLTFYLSVHRRRGCDLLALAPALGLVLMALTLNSHTSWAVARFGKLLVLPIAAVAGSMRSVEPARGTIRLVVGLAMLAGAFSQCFFLWYLARVYYPN